MELLLLAIVTVMLPLSIDAHRVKGGKPSRMPGLIGTLTTRWGLWSKDLDDRAKVAADERKRSQGLAAVEPRREWQDPFEEAQRAADDILERANEAILEIKRGEITSADYVETLESELRHVDDMMSAWREDHSAGLHSDEVLQEAIQQLRDAKQDLRDRKQNAHRLEPTLLPAGLPQRGKWIRFTYFDQDGVVTSREVTNWEVRGRYLVGFDREKRAERTFRHDRIEDWQC
ncbi:WYL domain-containing protein [Alteraurantiacibacter buctensis]|uniref:WYL domain-containing protein n=1 Tax=Alteraurantiacibacter buctensis TaxID=1503981 RepID=A0A844Z2H5_9SPHN|nr:WYL domain-containing protein [Alteraurantiacibacter buctensis]MXO73548.1 hypothetical protein [Alteraurantiacibacter buctensis]